MLEIRDRKIGALVKLAFFALLAVLYLDMALTEVRKFDY